MAMITDFNLNQSRGQSAAASSNSGLSLPTDGLSNIADPNYIYQGVSNANQTYQRAIVNFLRPNNLPVRTSGSGSYVVGGEADGLFSRHKIEGTDEEATRLRLVLGGQLGFGGTAGFDTTITDSDAIAIGQTMIAPGYTAGAAL
ncbi:MAG: hypothetical protein ACLFQV_08400 [Vulcanimicrobiota bacterium]